MQWAFLLPGIQVDYTGENEVLILGDPHLRLYSKRDCAVLDLTSLEVNKVTSSESQDFLAHFLREGDIVVASGVPERLLELKGRIDCFSLETADSSKKEVAEFERSAEQLAREIVFLEPEERLTLDNLIIFGKE